METAACEGKKGSRKHKEGFRKRAEKNGTNSNARAGVQERAKEREREGERKFGAIFFFSAMPPAARSINLTHWGMKRAAKLPAYNFVYSGAREERNRERENERKKGEERKRQPRARVERARKKSGSRQEGWISRSLTFSRAHVRYRRPRKGEERGMGGIGDERRQRWRQCSC